MVNKKLSSVTKLEEAFENYKKETIKKFENHKKETMEKFDQVNDSIMKLSKQLEGICKSPSFTTTPSSTTSIQTSLPQPLPTTTPISNPPLGQSNTNPCSTTFLPPIHINTTPPLSPVFPLTYINPTTVPTPPPFSFTDQQTSKIESGRQFSEVTSITKIDNIEGEVIDTNRKIRSTTKKEEGSSFPSLDIDPSRDRKNPCLVELFDTYAISGEDILVSNHKFFKPPPSPLISENQENLFLHPSTGYQKLYDILGPRTQNYIFFYGLKSYEGLLATNQIHVHIKVDYCITLIGSANINDRSVLIGLTNSNERKDRVGREREQEEMENSKKQRLVFRINQETKTHIQEKTETCLEIKGFHRNTNKNQQHSSMDEELFSNGDFDKSSLSSPLYLLYTKDDDVNTHNLDSSSPSRLSNYIKWGKKKRGRTTRRGRIKPKDLAKKAAETLFMIANNGGGSRRLLTEPTIDDKEVVEALLILSTGDDILVSTSSNLPNNKKKKKKKKRVMEVSELPTKKAKTGKENKNWKSKTWLDNHMVKLGFGSDDLSSNEEEGNDYLVVGKLDERPIEPKDFEMYLKKVVESYIMHYEKTRMTSNEFSEEVVSCMDAMKILTQVELEKKIDVSMPKNKSSVHECNICNMIFPTGQALGGHKRLHWTGPVTKSVVLIEEDEEKDGVEDHCKPLGGHERLHRTVPITESVVLIEEDEEKDGDEDHCKPLGGHERLHWTGPITKSVVLIEEDEEKDRDEDHRKPLMFDLNEPPPLSP